jgi:hypothetical protein
MTCVGIIFYTLIYIDAPALKRESLGLPVRKHDNGTRKDETRPKSMRPLSMRIE